MLGSETNEVAGAEIDRVEAASLKVAVGVATKGRPDQLDSMLENLRLQTLAPASVIICCTGPEDVGARAREAGHTIVLETPGSSRQRNAILEKLPADIDVVAFFDDDFYPHPTWLAEVAARFRDDPGVASITGNVVADGILGPGLTRDEALKHLAEHQPADHPWVLEGFSPYGCNMAFRRSVVEDLRFDERLVLYGWLEDRDFGGSVKHRGRLIKLGSAIGVHLGVKRGRVSGRKFGYSQVMNPLYLRRKQTMTTAQVVRQIGRNVAANLAKSVSPEPYVDRRGRLLGNLIAAGDLMRQRLTPERAELL